VSKARAYLSGAQVKGLETDSPTNIGLSQKVLVGANALAYLLRAVVAKKKSFITLTSGTNVIKIFTAVSYECS
jgi:hypothetical protein